MDGLAWRKGGFAFIFLILLAFGTFTGCGGGGGGTPSLTSGGGGGTTSGGGGGDIVSALKATLSGTLLSSSSSSGSSLFKQKMGKAAPATATASSSGLPVSGATVLCFDVDSVSTAAAGTASTLSDGTWTMDVDAGNYACFGIYIDLASLTIKVARMDDIAADAGEAVSVPEATVEADTTSPSIVSVLSDNVADTSLSDGDPDPLYEVSDVLPGQALSVIFSEAMNTSKMAPGTGVVLKDSSGTVVDMRVAFNGEGTEFRYTPSTNLTSGSTYTLYITNQAKDLSNNGINDPDSDGAVALARITVAESVDPFAYLTSAPEDDETAVNVYKDLTFTFNRPVDFVTFKNNVTVSPAISGRFEPSGDGVTLTHSAPLTANTIYTVTIGTGVSDLAGNPIASAQTISFTTGAGVDAQSLVDAGYSAGGGTSDDLLAILAGVTKAQLALENSDLVTFSSFFAPTFTMTEIECMDMGPMPGPVVAKAAAQTTGPAPGPGSPGGGCTTTTEDLSTFLDGMKKDLIEQRNMSKGFGQTERIPLTSYPTAGAQMSVEHFNSAFDANRSPIGENLYVGFPMHMEGVDFVNSQIDVPDPWSPGGTRQEFVTYRLDGSRGACRAQTDPSTDLPGAGEILASYHYWDPTLNRDTLVTKICPVYDGDADNTNSWAANDEIYPSSWTGPRNLWDDNDGDAMSCPTGNSWDCQNEDGIVSLKDANSDGTPDQAIRYYETVDSSGMRTPHADDITAQLSALTVAAALNLAVANNWDLEGIDNDGDSSVFYFDPSNPANGGWIDRRVNEDWPNGMDDDGDCDSNKDGVSDDANGDGIIDGTGRVCIDEDNDGLNSNPSPQDTDNDPTNDPMVYSDWNLSNKIDVTSNDEFWAQTYLVTDATVPGAASSPTWTDANGARYYVLAGPKGWPYPYAAGMDGRPWSGDEFDQYNSGDSRNSHIFAWGDVSVRIGTTIEGRVYFRSETKPASGAGSTFNNSDLGVYIDLTAAGIVDDAGNILTTATPPTISADPTNTSTRNRVSSGEEGSAIYRWNGFGQLANANGDTIDWQYVRPMMDSIDDNADGDWNVTTQASSGLRRVPHDRNTGGVMSEADYLALGWETWRVSNDLQLIDSANCPAIDAAGCTSWDVEADWARMEGDDDGDGQFNEDGLYADYFNTSDGSLKTCALSSDYPCMTADSNTGYLTLHKADGSTLDNDPATTTVAMFDISDGVDNDFDGNVDETEPWDDDGDGVSDEDPAGDPNDGDGNGDVTAPYDDDGDGRKDEDPVSYERDRMNDHTQWARVYQETTDAVVEMFYLKNGTTLNIQDLGIDSTGLKATAIVDIVNTETWTPHNPFGDDFNHDGVPDDVNTWTETMVFDLEKTGTKWLITSITPVESFDTYVDMVQQGQIQEFGGNVSRITMVSPVGTPETGPAANVGVTPAFQWDDSEIPATTPVGSYLIHIEEITEAMVTSGGEPTSAMILVVDPSLVTTDPVTGVKSFTLGTGEVDITTAFMTTFGAEVPFTTALSGLSATGAYSWGVLAFADDPATVQATITGGSKPEPIGDSFEPMMFAAGDLPTWLAAPSGVLKALGNGPMATAPKVKVGNKVYFAIPSNIAPNFYGR